MAAHISLRGIKDSAKRAMLKKAAKHIITKLVGSRINVSIQIDVRDLGYDKVPGLPDYTPWGLSTIDDDRQSPRSFHIDLHSGLKTRTLLKTLAHELTHCKQWIKNEMYDYLKPYNYTRWKGKIYPTDGDYDSTPWEKEAIAMESKLVRNFLTEHNIDLKNFV